MFKEGLWKYIPLKKQTNVCKDKINNFIKCRQDLNESTKEFLCFSLFFHPLEIEMVSSLKDLESKPIIIKVFE